ncbi:cryptococcal mannosyltransferase 1-domain-containing protein [Leptodontidium sp. MPI-SDFR-AT-0119]|nr:cryptococcal mannosyltransferase 1-domain-containing protein [Leptodontidium sp. MPI-SDFR-AT-0119]
MPSSRPTYDPLPRTSSSDSLTDPSTNRSTHARRRSQSSSSSSSSPEQRFKDKPFPPAPQHLLLSVPLLRYLHLRKTRRCATRILRKPLCILTFLLLLCLLLVQIAFNASYDPSSAPVFSLSATANETVFIAANILDGELITGAWGQSLVQLVDGIGRERVFVSVYGGPRGALKELERMLGEVEKRIVSEEEEGLDMGGMQRTVLPTGEKRVKRIAWLAEVRNKLLEPLYSVLDSGSGFMSTSTGASKKSKLELNPNPNFNSTSRFLSKDDTHLTFSKLLFINDVYFTPSDALRLLWGTNLDSNGVARYKAVCAADFVSSWKFYDTFATRDVEGYSIGVPIYPWFANEGEARSRRDVLEGRDSVRVRSCWGGMVAFEGGYFMGRGEGGEGVNADVHPTAQNAPKGQKGSNGENEIAKLNAAKNGLGVPSLPLRFRSEPEPFWDSSECCLIHADIISLPALSPSLSTPKAAQNNDGQHEEDKWDTGIYMNPYVRTSYSASTHSHIWLAKRFERLFSPVQRVLNYWAGMPRWNYRRLEREGEKVRDRLWISVHSNLTEGEAVFRAEHEFDFESESESESGGEGGKVERGLEKGLEKRETLGVVRGKEYWGNEGYYVDYERVAKRGGYCGVRQLLVMKEGSVGEGEGNWDNLLDRVPPFDV